MKWSVEEHEKFLAGLKKFGLQQGLGSGGAELLSVYIGNRSALQVKSHMQQHLAAMASRKRKPPAPDRIKACSHCRRRKLKCDGRSPCSSCVKAGELCDVQVPSGGGGGGQQNTDQAHLPTSKHPSSSPDLSVAGPSNSCRSTDDEEVQRVTTAIDPSEGAGEAEWGEENRGALTLTNRHLPSAWEEITAGKRPVGRVSPDVPLSFPHVLWRSPLDEAGPARPSPLSWFARQLFGNYRIAERHVEDIFAFSTPRLRAALKRITDQYEAMYDPPSPTRAQPCLPRETSEIEEEQERLEGLLASSRCGFQSLRFDLRNYRVQRCGGNDFWMGLAGVHREEFLTRAIQSELRPFSSELRVVCRLLFLLEKLLRFRLGLISPSEYFQDEVIYGRVTKGWANSGGAGQPAAAEGQAEREGVVTRLRLSRKVSAAGAALESRWSCVVLAPAEYDVVAQQHPDLCEPLASEVVGTLSAAQLAHPALERQESFQHLAGSPAGRATMDRLADALDRRYAWFYNHQPQVPTCPTPPSTQPCTPSQAFAHQSAPDLNPRPLEPCSQLQATSR